MKMGLRFGGIGLIVLGAVLAVIYFVSGPKAPAGEFSHRMIAKEKVITGAYKTYGVKDAPLLMWLAKSVFHNGTDGRIKELKVRYKVPEYSEWCSWHTYNAVDPDQTVVDLYYPILSSSLAKLTSRTPAELQMEGEYLDSMGQKHQISENRALSMLDRHEFIFSDLSSEERTSSFQDEVTYGALLAAWVSRGDDVVARLASIANKKAGGLGASGSDEDCIKVMAALYEIMRTIHISYQHPPALIDKSLSFDLKLVQSLQYPRDTIQKRSGTCIDLAILYAAMLNSVNIDPYLIVIDGHCFPMAKTPSGKLIPVEATGVGDGYGKSMDFAQAVESAMKTFQKAQESGRLIAVEIRTNWTSGIPNPELEPLPPDILESWGIVALVDAPAGRTTHATAPDRNSPSSNTNLLIDGRWGYALQMEDGSRVQGQIEISRKGNQVYMVAATSYSIQGQDGRQHDYSERDEFVGTMSGLNLTAQCNNAVMTFDGQRTQPQGLPFRLAVTLAADRRTMQGKVANASGNSVPIYMQKQ